MTTVLVTGAGGHLGRRVAHQLAADGISVRALVRTPRGPWPQGVEEIVGDVAHDAHLSAAASADVDAIIHLAGASEEALRADPTSAMADSIAAARQVAARPVPLVVYLSTVHVYGVNLSPGALITESTAVQPGSDYARARAACEEIIGACDSPSVIFRLTNGLGAPRHPTASGWQVVSNDLCRRGVTEGRLVLRSTGEQWRDFVPLVDVESALSALVRRPTAPSGTYNFASGTSITVRALAQEIQAVFASLDLPRPSLEMPEATGDLAEPYRVDVAALAALELFRPTSRRHAIEGVIRDCRGRRTELTADEASVSQP